MKLKGLPLLALIVLSFVWGYSWILNKLALLDAGPFGFAAARVLLGGLCLLLCLPLTGRSVKPPRPRELIVLGLVQTSGFVGLSMWALVEGGVGRTAILVFTMPFWMLLFAWPMLGERPRGAQWIGVALAAAGLLVILQPWHMSGSVFSKVLAVVSGAAWALGSVMVKRIQYRAPMDLLGLTTWQMLFGAVPLLLVHWLSPEHAIVWSDRFIVILVLSAVASTALGWLIWIYVLKHLPAGLAGLGTLAIPVVAIVSSTLQLGERLHRDEIAGIVLIGVALLVLAMRGVIAHRETVAPVVVE
ncbi:MAG: EamA family transporter [Gammaproteobacteria bacterium]|nr:EamA family transporter [Gammaproteobacteria bacterium]MBI5617389.1 EamA family transporter [Gammaproteobacteria bacterium]